MRGSALLLIWTACWWSYHKFVPLLKPSVIAQSYFALIPLYLLGQLLSTLFELLYLPTGWHFPAHFQDPPLSKTLAEFWGIRWASWFSDWMRQIVFSRLKGRPIQGICAVFLLSGLLHELLINLPLYIFYRVNCLGSMMIYFLIQAVGLTLERKLPIGNELGRRLYLWIVVVVPAPLVMNEGVLRAVGLY